MIYDREVPFELRVQESSEGPQPVGTLEAIKVKLLVLGHLGEGGGLSSVRMELSRAR